MEDDATPKVAATAPGSSGAADGMDRAGDDEASLKIDDLARITGITVDTIRFYQREGLLPDAPRLGRSISYGPEHVRALERVKDLQAKHFSLRAIKALAEEGRLGMVEDLFRAEADGALPGEEAEVDPDLMAELAAAGLVAETGAGGSYSPEDLPAARAAHKLVAAGLPRSVVLVLVETLVKKFSEWEKEVAAAVIGQYRTTLGRELEKLVSQNPEVLSSVVPLTEVIFHRVQTRSMQNVVQEAVESLVEEA